MYAMRWRQLERYGHGYVHMLLGRMRAEEFDSATVEELQALADDCFERADQKDPVKALHLGPDERMRLLMKAQFYLAAVARKRDEATAKRDFNLEIAVIVLIGMEILLSFVFGFWGIHEGNQQAAILEKLRKSTDATASAMSAASGSLKTLADEQAKSLDRLQEMSDKLGESLKGEGNVAAATRKQLQILKEDQDSRLAQQAKKPKLVLYVGEVPLGPESHQGQLAIREQTDTTITFDCSLKNDGDATATKPLMRIMIVGKDIGVTVSPMGAQQPPEQPNSPSHTFLVGLDSMRRHTAYPMVITFTFPKGASPFPVYFNVDADEIETATPLASITVAPRKPQNQ